MTGVLGVLVGLAGIGAAYYFYKASHEERDPIFGVGPERIQIISGDDVRSAPIKITRQGGSEVNEDVYAVNLYFWNRGKLAIKPGDILEPLKIRIAEGEILDHSIVHTSREVTSIRVTRNAEDPDSTLDLNFRILEEGDGFSMRLLYAGSRSASIELMGAVEGVQRSLDASPLKTERLWSSIADFTLVLAFAAVTLMVPIGVFAALSWASMRLKVILGENHWVLKMMSSLESLLVVGLIVVVLVIGVGGPFWKAVRESAGFSTDSVPPELQSEPLGDTE